MLKKGEYKMTNESDLLHITKYDKEKAVILFLFKHYKDIIIKHEEIFSNIQLPEKCGYQNLLKLAQEVIDNSDKYPNDKLQRWLGFTQGVLSTLGIIDVDKEREFTRPYLHSYQNEKPATFG